MVFDLDPFDDPEPTNCNARAGSKFQPRAKLQSGKCLSTVSNVSKEKSFTTSSNLCDISKEKPVTTPSSLQASTQTVLPVDPSGKSLTQSMLSSVDTSNKTADSSFKLSGSCDLADNTEASDSVAPFSAVGISLPVDQSSQLVDAIKDLGSTDILHPEATVSDNHEDWHSGFARSRGESTDIFFEWEDFDNFLSQTTNTTAVDTFSKLPVMQDPATCKEVAVSNDNEEDLQMEVGGSKKEEAEAFSCLRTLEYISEVVTTSDSIPEAPVIKELTHSAVTSNLDADLPEEFVDSQTVSLMSREVCGGSRRETSAVSEKLGMIHSTEFEELSHWAPSEGLVPAAVEENEAVKPRQLRKRVAVSVPVDDLENETHKNGGLLDEPTNNSVLDETDNNDGTDEYTGETTSRRKRVSRKSKARTAGNEKPVRRRKKVSEEPDHQLNKESTRKKFSHSTRRNKRRVDKALLETPDDEIDPKKLIIKDLILLAEAKERISNKDAALLKKTFPNQSADNTFSHDAPYDEKGTFVSKEGFNSDEDDDANPRFEVSTVKINYQSFMDKKPKERWTKQDTELFYEAIQQFGTDFAMIQQLFPGRTRRQVKLKYKKEERQHPLRLSDALSNRSKGHSHFELVIERLKQAAAAQAEQSSNKDEESIDAVSEEANLETNVEVEKPEHKQEEVSKDLEGDVPDVQDPMKSHEPEDDYTYDIWSQYKSEL